MSPFLNKFILRRFYGWISLSFFFYFIFTGSILITYGWTQSTLKKFDGKIIKEIGVEGNKQFSDKQILGFFNLIPDTPLNFSDFRRNFKAIYRSGFLRDIKVDIVEEAEELIITFIVQENFKVGKLFFVGNDTFSSLQLLNELKSIRFNYFDTALANDGRFTIIRKYLEKGYLDVKVDYISEPSPKKEDTVDITYLIQEGSRYLVKEINFNGNTNVASKKLRQSMNLKLDTFFKTGLYDPINLEIDKERLEYQLRDNGYYKGKITNIEVSYEWKPNSSKKDKSVIIDIGLEEGSLHYFGKVTLKGNTLFSRDEIFFDFRRKEGEVFRQSIHDKDIRSIYSKYQPNGYIFIRITPIEIINSDFTIDFVFDIYEGDKAHIENIFVEGLVRTKNPIVTRELNIEEGEIFDVDKIRSSIFNLNRLDFFSEVKPDYRIGSTEGLMNLYFLITEKSTAKISGGFAYSFSTGLSLNAQYQDRNFLGIGHNFTVKTGIGLVLKNFSISYTEPWFLHLPIALGGSFQLSKQYVKYYTDDNDKLNPAGKTTISSPDQGDRGYVNDDSDSIHYTKDRIEVSIFSSQRLGQGFKVSESASLIWAWEYLQKFKIWPEEYNQYEIYEYNQKLFNEPPPINDKIFSFKLGLGVSFDNRDSILHPSSGIYSSLSADLYFNDYSLIIWGFNTGLYKSIAWRLNAFPNLLWKLTFAYKFKFRTLGRSLINNFKASDSLNFSLNRTELRGWEYSHILSYRKGLGGKSYLINERPYGQSFFVQNFEIMQNFGFDLLQMVYFFDIGNLSANQLSFADAESWNFLFNWQEFLFSSGFGFRLNFPQLPIRLYFTWRFIYDPRVKTLVGYENPTYSSNEKAYKPTVVFDIQGFF